MVLLLTRTSYNILNLNFIQYHELDQRELRSEQVAGQHGGVEQTFEGHPEQGPDQSGRVAANGNSAAQLVCPSPDKHAAVNGPT